MVPTLLAINHNCPIDYIAGILILFTIGVKLFGSHIYFVTFVISGVLKICGGQEGHYNYEIP
jgi:hypothetical protein